MTVLQEREIAFISMEAAAFFLLGGLIWYTTPFRRRGGIGDKLFFYLELLCLVGFISDIFLFLGELDYRYGMALPLDHHFFFFCGTVFDVGEEYFDAILVLYAAFLATGDEKLLKKIKVPILILPTLMLISMHSFSYLPDAVQMFMLEFISLGEIFYLIYQLATLVLIFKFNRKLFFYYLLAYAMVVLLSRIQPEALTAEVIYVQILTFTHIMMRGSKGILPLAYDSQHAHFMCNVLLSHS